MAGKMSAINRYKGRTAGFSLIEIMVIIMIMLILTGITGSLMSEMASHFEASDDQGIARRRARDMFNVLKQPVLGAGLGIPSAGLKSYFSLGSLSAPVAGWGEPVSVLPGESFGGRSGNVLRIIYALRSGGRNGESEITSFSTKNGSSGPAYCQTFINSEQKMKLTKYGTPGAGGADKPHKGGFGIVEGGWPPAGNIDMRSYVTFPGIHNNPLYVTKYDDGADPEIFMVGMTPRETSGDVMWRNVIHPYHEICLVRAAVAYVDDESAFCFAEVTSKDYPLNALPRGRDLESGFTIEGIKAARFEVVENGRVLRITAVAEGDNTITGKRGSAGTQALRTAWPDVDFRDDTYYEEFSMSLRTRNIEGR